MIPRPDQGESPRVRARRRRTVNSTGDKKGALPSEDRQGPTPEPYPPEGVLGIGPPGDLHPKDRHLTNHSQVSRAALARALSRERIGAYSLEEDEDSFRIAVARYLWNLGLCAALTPLLHVLEITLRNGIFDASRRVVDETGMRFNEVRCWLDARDSLLYGNEANRVAEARRHMHALREPMTTGKLINRLSFGFWVNLLNAPYSQNGNPDAADLWPAAIPHAFPNVPRRRRNRVDIRSHFDRVRESRNRISHHEPIWDRDPLAIEKNIIDGLAWMNPSLAAVTAAESCVGELVAGSHAAYLDQVDRILKQD